MKIAVTATEPSLDAQVDPRFGRCQCFLIVETDDMSFEAVKNPNIAVGGGAGIQSAKLISDQGATVVLTGNCGPNAFSALEAAGVQVIVGMAGNVKDVIDAYKSGNASPAGGANVQSHFGTGSGSPQTGGSMGMGGGGGGGMGGGGMGMGRGMGRGRGMGGGQMAPQAPMNEEQELQALKGQAQQIQDQLKQVTDRIDELDKNKS